MFKIRKYREAAGLTQAQLAERIGVTLGAVSQWELGLCNPKSEHLPKLAAALGCTIGNLYGEEAAANGG